MSLHNLKREYEERRSALIEQLQKNPQLDPATQHQIYGAIKEIENFLKTIEYQVTVKQEENQSPEPAVANQVVQTRRNPIVHVARGTGRIFTHHIPSATKRVVTAPKRFFDRRAEERRLRKEIEAEVKARREAQLSAPQPPIEQAAPAESQDHIVLEHPHQELQQQHEEPLPTWTDETAHKEEPLQPRTINSHVKRKKPAPVKVKHSAKPSARSRAKHQHKPHLKRDKYTRR
jgi:hypothetical protein